MRRTLLLMIRSAVALCVLLGVATPARIAAAATPTWYLTTPVAPSKVAAWSTFRVHGYVRPRRPVGSSTVVIKAYRFEDGRWVLRRSVRARNSDYSTYTRYSASLALPGSGPARWRLVAYAPEGSGYASTYSAFRYLTVPMIEFRSVGFSALDVPQNLRPFHMDELPPSDIPSNTVIYREIDGVSYDSATRQAQSGYKWLNAYITFGNPDYLTKAKVQADHMIATRHVEGDGWFYRHTYPWVFPRPWGGALVSPWYSGLAQGTSAGFFARLYEVTGDPRYRDAAGHTVRSLLIPRRGLHAWVTRVDPDGYVTFEHYPGTPWRFVLNGHMEAVAGLYDYYKVTGDPVALKLYRGGLATVVRYGESFRRPGGISAYSSGAPARYASYHRQHVLQLLQLHAFTGDSRLSGLANRLDNDYPIAETTGTITVRPGTHTAYRFSSAGGIVASREIVVPGETTYDVRARTRVNTRTGMWFVVSGSDLDGYCLLERAGYVHFRGAASVLEYPRPLRATMRVGAWNAVTLGAQGTVADTRTVLVDTALPVTVAKRAVVNGNRCVMLATGPVTDMWVPSAAVVLR